MHEHLVEEAPAGEVVAIDRIEFEPPGGMLGFLITKRRILDELESELIRYAITHYRGQMSEVARRLRIGRSTLYRRLEALGLNCERLEMDSDAVAAERQPRKIA